MWFLCYKVLHYKQSKTAKHCNTFEAHCIICSVNNLHVPQFYLDCLDNILYNGYIIALLITYKIEPYIAYTTIFWSLVARFFMSSHITWWNIFLFSILCLSHLGIAMPQHCLNSCDITQIFVCHISYPATFSECHVVIVTTCYSCHYCVL